MVAGVPLWANLLSVGLGLPILEIVSGLMGLIRQTVMQQDVGCLFILEEM